MNQNKIKIIAVLLLLCISAAWLERYEIQESGQNLSGQMADKMKQNTDEPQNLYAQSAVLMDADSGRVLFGKEEEAIRPMASTTKIMTCIIALEHMTDNEIVTVSAYAASQPKVHLGVREGQQFYLKDILFSLMLESHNDSAVMVAEEIAGSVEMFVKMMNEKAEELGLTKTHFVTPNGLEILYYGFSGKENVFGYYRNERIPFPGYGRNFFLYLHESQCFSDYDGRGDFWQDRFYGRCRILLCRCTQT